MVVVRCAAVLVGRLRSLRSRAKGGCWAGLSLRGDVATTALMLPIRNRNRTPARRTTRMHTMHTAVGKRGNEQRFDVTRFDSIRADRERDESGPPSSFLLFSLVFLPSFFLVHFRFEVLIHR
jgi:hypothetical protein